MNGADGIVINMVVGGEVATLKALEENSGLLIAEMPIHVRYTPLFILLSSSILLRSKLKYLLCRFQRYYDSPSCTKFKKLLFYFHTNYSWFYFCYFDFGLFFMIQIVPQLYL